MTIMGATKRVNQHTALPMPERFLSKIKIDSNGCWIWCAYVDDIGYGRFPCNGENKAHRVSYSYFVSSIPKEMKVLHKCDVRNCVNPDHLFLGTQAENIADMINKKRNKTVSLYGEDNPMSKLTRKQVYEIRSYVSKGIKQIEVSRMFNVSPMTISRIIRRELWK